MSEIESTRQGVGVQMQPGHIILRHPFDGFVTFGAVVNDHVSCFFGDGGLQEANGLS